MNTLRKIVLSLLVIGFSGLVFVVPSLWTLRLTVMDRNVTTGWLRDSKVYDNFVSALAETAEKQLQKSGEANTSNQNIDVAALTRAAQAAFPADVLRENVESVLDGAYNWLEGSTDGLVFNLDLTEEKAAFVDALGNEALSRASALPACPEGQLPESFDPLAAECLPSGTSIQAEIDKIKNEIATSNEVLPDTQLSGQDIKVDVNGQQKPLDEAFSEGPTWYQRVSWLPLTFTILAGVCVILILLLARPHRGGLKILAWLFGPAGVLLILSGLAAKLVADRLDRGGIRLGDTENGIAENVAVPLIGQINHSFAKWNLIFGAAYLGLTVLLALIYLVTKPKKSEAPSTDNSETIKKEEAKPVAHQLQDTEGPKEVKGPPTVSG